MTAQALTRGISQDCSRTTRFLRGSRAIVVHRSIADRSDCGALQQVLNELCVGRGLESSPVIIGVICNVRDRDALHMHGVLCQGACLVLQNQ